jgi:hypothetical protein
MNSEILGDWGNVVSCFNVLNKLFMEGMIEALVVWYQEQSSE